MNKKTLLFSLGIAWLFVCASVLVLNLVKLSDQPPTAQTGWWYKKSLAQIKSSSEYKVAVDKFQISALGLRNPELVKKISESSESSILVLFTLVEFPGINQDAILDPKFLSADAFSTLHPEFVAVLGSSAVRMANEVTQNIDKLSWVQAGLELIDSAILKDPENPIPHLIRLATNKGLPAFLQRNNFVEEDLKFTQRTTK